MNTEEINDLLSLVFMGIYEVNKYGEESDDWDEIVSQNYSKEIANHLAQLIVNYKHSK